MSESKEETPKVETEKKTTTTRKPRKPKINFPNLAPEKEVGQSNKGFKVEEHADKVWVEIVRTAGIMKSSESFDLGVKGNEPQVIALHPKSFYEQYIYPILREKAFTLDELKEAKDIFKMLMISSDDLMRNLERNGVLDNVRSYKQKETLTKRLIPFCHFPSANGQQIKKNPAVPAGRVLSNVLHIPGLTEKEIETFTEFLQTRNS